MNADGKQKPRRIARHICDHCGCWEGQYHKDSCPEERCSVCGGRRIACQHDDGGKRLPFIQYPLENFCACCGEPQPAGFHVANGEWAKYIQPDKRRERICRECYDRIKTIIDSVGRG